MTLAPGRQPHFDRDYEYGRQGELLIDDFLNRIARGDGTVETKRKTIRDVELYIELEHDPGRTGEFIPSGLSTTTADMWTFVIGDTRCHLAVETNRIRRAVTLGLGRPKECTDGSCPTRGRILNFALLISARCDP